MTCFMFGVNIPRTGDVDGYRVFDDVIVVVVCWLLYVPATCLCVSGTDVLRQLNLLPH